MHEVTSYSIIWLVAVLASACRSIRDDDWRDSRHLIASAATSGFVALGIVTFLDYSLGRPRIDWAAGGGVYIGIASLAGALKTEQELAAKALFEKVFPYGRREDEKRPDEK